MLEESCYSPRVILLSTIALGIALWGINLMIGNIRSWRTDWGERADRRLMARLSEIDESDILERRRRARRRSDF